MKINDAELVDLLKTLSLEFGFKTDNLIKFVKDEKLQLDLNDKKVMISNHTETSDMFRRNIIPYNSKFEDIKLVTADKLVKFDGSEVDFKEDIISVRNLDMIYFAKLVARR